MKKSYDLSGLWQMKMFEGAGSEGFEFAASFCAPESGDKNLGVPVSEALDKGGFDTMHLPATTAQEKKGVRNEEAAEGYLSEVYPFSGSVLFTRMVSLSDLVDGNEDSIKLYIERTRITRVWVNYIEVTDCNTSDSLVAPHIYDLTEMLRRVYESSGQENLSDNYPSFRLSVLVTNIGYPVPGGHLTSPDTQTNWIGMLGRLSLDVYPEVYIDKLHVYSDIDRKVFEVRGKLANASSGQAKNVPEKNVPAKNVPAENVPMESNPPQKDISLSEKFDIDVFVEDSILVEKELLDVTIGEGGEFSFDIHVKDMDLWSDVTPVSYKLVINLPIYGDKYELRAGFRKITAEGLDIKVNGHKVFFRGKHDGLVFPLTGAAPMDVEEWMRVLAISKEYGINHYRFHTCCPPEAAFEAADYLGIYMCPELPFWGTIRTPDEEGYDERAAHFLIEEGRRMLEYFGDHPSFVMMSMGNELWGNKDGIEEMLSIFSKERTDKLYTQGSNDFQFDPVILPSDDYFVGVRFGRDRLIRGSYAMCDAPLGFVQTDEPTMAKDYDDAFTSLHNASGENNSFLVQYGTGVKEVSGGGAAEFKPTIPVISHEIGQYAVFPDINNKDKYIGVLEARQFDIYRQRLRRNNLEALADRMTYCSGMLAVQCYKEELEAAFKTRGLSGFQLLDLQDFPGQNGAYVGILDSFMDNKGLIDSATWKGFCNDVVLMARFKSFILTAGKTFDFDILVSDYNYMGFWGDDEMLQIGLYIDDKCDDDIAFMDYEIDLPVDMTDLGIIEVGSEAFPIPKVDMPTKAELYLKWGSRTNRYDLYIFPEHNELSSEEEVIRLFNNAGIAIARSQEELDIKSEENGGRNILYLPEEIEGGIKGTYATDFWCYKMFREISLSMGKEIPIGTMGLMIDNDSSLFDEFTTEEYTTPVWYHIVENSTLRIMDGDKDVESGKTEIIVRMIDNFERAHSLGLIMKHHLPDGHFILEVTSPLLKLLDKIEVRNLVNSIYEYMRLD